MNRKALNFSRDTRIRTWDPLVPNQVRYRTALHPELLLEQKNKERRERDSNPRYRCQYVSLANWWFQPLTHPSESIKILCDL
jgi:hypothetical protein